MTVDKKKPESKGFKVRDQRWWLQPDAGEDAGAQENGEAGHRPTFVEELEARLAEKDRVLREYIEAHKSSVADLDGVRARLERDVDRRVKQELAQLLTPFIEVLDNLTRLRDSCVPGASSETLKKGTELLLNRVDELLKKQGVERITTQGARFDPKIMEALATGEGPPEQDGLVLEEFHPGYLLGNMVIRPAGVRVGVSRAG